MSTRYFDDQKFGFILICYAAAGAMVISCVASVNAVLMTSPNTAVAAMSGSAMMCAQLAKVALPHRVYRLHRRGEKRAARMLGWLWTAPMLVCCVASVIFINSAKSRPVSADLLARKEQAVRSLTLAANSEELDYGVYVSDQKRLRELRSEISELRASPPAAGDSFELTPRALGQSGLALLMELLSAASLTLATWSAMSRDEKILPAAPIVEPVAEEVPLLLSNGPAFRSAAARIEGNRTTWLWPGFLPSGAMTLLTGQPKIGKSQIAISVAATVSSGGLWPTGERAEAGGVILMEVEDSHSDTQDRLRAAGADLRRISIRDRETGPLDLSGAGMDELKAEAARLGGVKLVVVSPGLAFFGKAGATDDATVRARLSPMLMWAAQNKIAVLMIMHPAKNAGQSLQAQFAGADAYRRAARSAFVAMSDGKRRVFACAGVNGGADDLSIAYRIEGVMVDGHQTSKVVWAEPVYGGNGPKPPSQENALPAVEPDGDAWEDSRSSKSARVQDWLSGALAGGPLPGARLKELAAMAGFTSNASLYRAADALGVIRDEKSEFGGSALWGFPQHMQKSA